MILLAPVHAAGMNSEYACVVQNRLLDHLESYGRSRRDIPSCTWNALLGARRIPTHHTMQHFCAPAQPAADIVHGRGGAQTTPSRRLRTPPIVRQARSCKDTCPHAAAAAASQRHTMPRVPSAHPCTSPAPMQTIWVASTPVHATRALPATPCGPVTTMESIAETLGVASQ